MREREIIGAGAVTASLPTEGRSERVRVYSGACSLVIDRVEESKRQITGLAEKAGGYVEQSTGERIVVRVPAGVFRKVVDDIHEIGEVRYKEVLSILADLEALRGQYRKLQGEVELARVQIDFRLREGRLPAKLPSSFPWIDSVDFYLLMREFEGR